jgi:hypothetical protein
MIGRPMDFKRSRKAQLSKLMTFFVVIATMLQQGVVTSGYAKKPEKAPNGFCQVVVIDSGELRDSTDSMSLNSLFAGGRAGLVQVTTNKRNFSLTIDPPVGFDSSPLGGNDDLSITTSFQGSGATNFAQTPGDVRIRLEPGITQVETHVSAVRYSSLFPAGAYGINLNIRCEK